MSWLLIVIALIILGILLLMLEIFVLPGTTVAGIAGTILIVYAIWKSYSVLGSTNGTLVLISTLVLLGVFAYLTYRFGNWKKVALKTSLDGKVNENELDNINVDDEGVAVSRLAPSGKALINDIICEVHTYNEFIDQDTEIKVINKEDNKIYVTLKN
ncbi:MAG: NfeD family protein [Bacteroidales bacterium]|jgi:membrane-bound ClpP family serine protease